MISFEYGNAVSIAIHNILFFLANQKYIFIVDLYWMKSNSTPECICFIHFVSDIIKFCIRFSSSYYEYCFERGIGMHIVYIPVCILRTNDCCWLDASNIGHILAHMNQWSNLQVNNIIIPNTLNQLICIGLQLK